jgi:hypothetical protein
VIHFPRDTLAQELVAALRGQAVFGDAHNGLFLAAPRRTGKSTFLQADLKPALEAAGLPLFPEPLARHRQPGPGEFAEHGRGLGNRTTRPHQAHSLPPAAQAPARKERARLALETSRP